MKLYTENDIRIAIYLTANSDHDTYSQILNKITPIELPSDEEIEKEVPFSKSTFGFEQGQYQGFIMGAKWVIDKIKNQQQ